MWWPSQRRHRGWARRQRSRSRRVGSGGCGLDARPRMCRDPTDRLHPPQRTSSARRRACCPRALAPGAAAAWNAQSPGLEDERAGASRTRVLRSRGPLSLAATFLMCAERDCASVHAYPPPHQPSIGRQEGWRPYYPAGYHIIRGPGLSLSGDGRSRGNLLFGVFCVTHLQVLEVNVLEVNGVHHRQARSPQAFTTCGERGEIQVSRAHRGRYLSTRTE